MEKATLFKILDVSIIKRERASIVTNNINYNIISYRLKGEGEFKYKNKRFTLTPDDILFIPKGASYSQVTNGEEIMCIHFEAYGELSKDLQVIKMTDKEKMLQLLNRILECWGKKTENYFYYSTAYFYEIMANISNIIPNDAEGAISKLLEYIEMHYTDSDFKISDMYEACHTSHSGVNAIFKKEMGKTPSEYVNELKIRKAKILLSGNCFTTTEIAELCGFRDIKYFYTVFHKVSGCTIREYKESCCKI